MARRPDRLAGERERLLELHLAGDIDRETLRHRKPRIEEEVRELESRTADRTA